MIVAVGPSILVVCMRIMLDHSITCSLVADAVLAMSTIYIKLFIRRRLEVHPSAFPIGCVKKGAVALT